jgi:hypothetical protein
MSKFAIGIATRALGLTAAALFIVAAVLFVLGVARAAAAQPLHLMGWAQCTQSGKSPQPACAQLKRSCRANSIR